MYDPSKSDCQPFQYLNIKNQNMMLPTSSAEKFIKFSYKCHFYNVNAEKENKCLMEHKTEGHHSKISQDRPLELNDEESSKNGLQSSNDKAIANQSSKRVSLPHNCEDILKHADSPVDVSAMNIWEVLYTGVSLNQKRKKTSILQKYWVDKQSNCNCFMVFAKSLSITWVEDKRFWNWPLLKESSDEYLAVAELLDVCWLEVHGRFEISNLSPGRLYEVIFVVMLKDPAYGWEVPVNLRLTSPDGCRHEHKENLMEKPRGRWIEIPAGEIKSSTEKTGEMEFSLYEYEGGTWKKGLLIKGVKIQLKA